MIVSALLIGLTGTAAAGNDKVEVPADLKPIFEEKADEYGIDEYFLEALAWRESRFKTTASNGNCKGLMEVNVKYYPHDWKDPEQNIDAACRCIIAIINQYDAEDLGDIASLPRRREARIQQLCSGRRPGTESACGRGRRPMTC